MAGYLMTTLFFHIYLNNIWHYIYIKIFWTNLWYMKIFLKYCILDQCKLLVGIRNIIIYKGYQNMCISIHLWTNLLILSKSANNSWKTRDFCDKKVLSFVCFIRKLHTAYSLMCIKFSQIKWNTLFKKEICI